MADQLGIRIVLIDSILLAKIIIRHEVGYRIEESLALQESGIQMAVAAEPPAGHRVRRQRLLNAQGPKRKSGPDAVPGNAR
ncbi:hypothetical protein [Azospirillum sp. TSH64]|uniref:hypothetical protein n=1 Tax=Azospirillum sp. TSH64 TaxID=652740 RepID=UPI0011B286BD|nr:hypothetical protein [Azospirillum sp. TSH64]